MDSGELEEIKSLFSPLIEDYGEVLKSIIIYGSAVRKERVEGSDIDVLVIIDDNSEELEKKDLKEIKNYQDRIKEKGEEKGFELHIQPPKPVSNWLNLLIQGQPWSVTAIKYSESIYDPDDFQSTLQKLVKSTPPGSKRERSVELLQQAESDLDDVEQLLERSFEQLIQNIYSSGKTYLKFHENHISSNMEMIEELEFRDINMEFFEEILDFQEKFNSSQKQIAFEKLEEHTRKSLRFIEEINTSLEGDLNEIREEIRTQTLKEMKESCKILLDELEVKYSEKNIFERFREEVIQKDILSKEYWKFIEDTKENNLDKNQIYRPLAELRDFEAAVDNIIDNNFYKSFDLQSESESAQITPINEFEEEIIEKFEEIKGLYVLTRENLLETETATLIVLVDDTGEDSKSKKIQKYADRLERRIGEEHGFNIHTETLKLTNYWKKVQEADEKVIYEVKTGIISYDPQGLLKSTEKLIGQGRIRSTAPEVVSEFKETERELLLPLEKIRTEGLESYYKASIKIGQALLLQKNITPPVQKKVPEILEREAIEDSEITEEDVDMIEEVIGTYKQKEYGNKEKIDISELDKIRLRLREIKNKVDMR